MRHDNNFNFLRFWLAWVVILSHSFELIDGNRSRELLTQLFGTWSFGELAVNAFFLMSGYFIAQSWVAAPQVGIFMRKRLLRLLPGFIVAVLISIFIVGPLGSPTFWDQFPHWRFWPGLLVLHFNPPYSFPGWPYPMINGPLWTLHFEYMCYWLVVALGILGCVQRPRVLLGLFLTLLLAWMAVRYVQASHWRPVTRAGFLAWNMGGHYVRLTALFVGGMLWFNWQHKLRLNALTLLIATALFVLLMFRYNGAVLAMLPLAVMLHWIGYKPLPALRIFQGADLSYGMYLYAWPIQKLLLFYGVTRDPWVLTVWTTLLSIIAGWLSWTLVEKPFLRRKPQPAALSAAAV